MKKILLSTMMIATMMVTASLLVQDSDCSKVATKVTKSSENKQLREQAKQLRKEMSGIKKRFGTHKDLLAYSLNVLENLNEGVDPLNIRTRQLIKQLNKEISQILRNPEKIDSDACKSLQTIRDYLVSIQKKLKKKKAELATKFIEELEPVSNYVKELEAKETLNQEVPPPLPPRPKAKESANEEEEVPPPLPPRNKAPVSDDVGNNEAITSGNVNVEGVTPQNEVVDSSSDTAEDKTESKELAPQVPADYAVAPTPPPSPAPTSLEVPEEYRSAPTPPPAPTTLSASVSKTEPKGITVNDIQEVHLKKTGDSATPTTTPPEEVKNSASNDLMAQIRAGKRLKTREERDEELKKKGIPTMRNGGVSAKDQALDTSTSLFNAIRGRRISMREDEEEEGDDSEWNDD